MHSPNPPSLRPSVSPSYAPICPHPRFQHIPQELKLAERWALWRVERNRHGAWRKTSFQPSGRRASRNDSKTWSSFEAVRSAFQQSLRSATPYDGIAFALGDGFTAIHLTGVLPEIPEPCATGGARAPSIGEQEQEALSASGHAETPNTKHQTLPAPTLNPSVSPSLSPSAPSGTPLAWASQLVAEFATYTEFNVDGRSLTLFLHGPVRRKPADSVVGPLEHPEGGLIEATDEPRFVGVSGHRWPANSTYQIEHRKTQFQALTRHLQSGHWPLPISGATGSASALKIEEQEQESNKASGPVSERVKGFETTAIRY